MLQVVVHLLQVSSLFKPQVGADQNLTPDLEGQAAWQVLRAHESQQLSAVKAHACLCEALSLSEALRDCTMKGGGPAPVR